MISYSWSGALLGVIGWTSRMSDVLEATSNYIQIPSQT
jgi:hypothetical protein